MKHKKVYIMSGCPGSGKSTWCRNRVTESGGVHCSRDEIRFSLLKEGEDYFSHEDEVINIWMEKVRQAILSPDAGDVYIDATHLTEKTRAKVIESLPATNYTITIVFFKTSLETCLERNEKRDWPARVPRSVLRRMFLSHDTTTHLADEIIYVEEDEE